MLEADPQVLSWVTPYFFPLQVLNFQDFLNFVLTLFLPFSTELQEQEMGHQKMGSWVYYLSFTPAPH